MLNQCLTVVGAEKAWEIAAKLVTAVVLAPVRVIERRLGKGKRATRKSPLVLIMFSALNFDGAG